MMKCRDFGGSLIMFDYPYQAEQFKFISKLFTNHIDVFIGGDDKIWFYIGATRQRSANNKDFYYDKVFPGSFFPRNFFPDAF